MKNAKLKIKNFAVRGLHFLNFAFCIFNSTWFLGESVGEVVDFIWGSSVVWRRPVASGSFSSGH
jgi:hypothetical protein